MSAPDGAVEAPPSAARFVVLGRIELRALHEENLRGLPHDFVFVDTLPDLLCEIVRRTPTAVLIDLAMIVKTKSDFGYLFELDVTFPFLRFVVGSDGCGALMSMSPPRRAEMRESLAQIAAGDTSWSPADRRRRYIRLEVDCRARFRVKGDSDWIHANLRDISQGGCSIITVVPPAVEDRVELELLDLTPEPIRMDTDTVWRMRWEESQRMPGAGLSWHPDSITQSLREALGEPERVKRIVRGCQPT